MQTTARVACIFSFGRSDEDENSFFAPCAKMRVRISCSQIDKLACQAKSMDIFAFKRKSRILVHTHLKNEKLEILNFQLLILNFPFLFREFSDGGTARRSRAKSEHKSAKHFLFTVSPQSGRL